MYSHNMQVQALTDRLAGIPVKAQERDFTGPFRILWRALDQHSDTDPQRVMEIEVMRNRDLEPLVEEIFTATPGVLLPDFPAVAGMASLYTPVTWLWENWIPRGMISLLGSAPGAGKSFVAFELVRRLLGGLPFPDGKPHPGGKQCVIYFDTEAIFNLQYERARDFGLDLSRLYFPPMDNDDYIDFSRDSWRELLVEMTARVQPSLVVIDSLSNAHSGAENGVEDVRDLLNYFNRLAGDFNIALLLIHHLRKSASQLFGRLDIEDFRGSGHIIAMARSVLGLSIVKTGPSPDRNGPRRLEVIKTNITRYPPALGLEFVSAENGKPRLEWGEPADEYKPPSSAERCSGWLLKALAEHGSLTASEAVTLGEQAGYSRSTVFRAHHELEGRIISGKDAKQRRVWMLAETGGQEGGQTPLPGLE